MSPSLIWKLVLAVLLVATILAGACVRAPRHSYPQADLKGLLFAALVLYCVGLAASLSDHEALAALLYAGGIGASAFAVWLSRGTDSGEPPRDDVDDESPPPTGPDEPPEFDWDAFERQLRVYADRRDRQPAGRQ